MKSLVVERSVARFAATRAASLLGSGRGVSMGVGPLRLTDIPVPDPPGPDWQTVRPILAGICGSDLSMLDGHSSRYFEGIVSFPFVPGHEVLAETDDGRRVVIEPVLGCIARGIEPPCASCARGHPGGCERVAFGHLQPGLQTGYCADTGGGWSGALVAHQSQLHYVPQAMSDEAAVVVEPTASAIHAVGSAQIAPGELVVVLGSGTLGLCTLAALRWKSLPALLIASAKYSSQRELAVSLGADVVVEPGELRRAVRRHTRSLAVGGQLTNGADIVIDCVGTGTSIEESIAIVRPRGRVVLLGMPGVVRVDLAPLWHREVSLKGTYTYGTEEQPEGRVRTFDLAFELVADADLGRLVSQRYPLEAYEDAIAHAAEAGRRGATKIVFDLRAKSPSRTTASARIEGR